MLLLGETNAMEERELAKVKGKLKKKKKVKWVSNFKGGPELKRGFVI